MMESSESLPIPRDPDDYSVDKQWMASARCAETDPEMFYPEDFRLVPRAVRFCGQCAVREECLNYAITHKVEHGVWGGVSEKERRRMFRSSRSTI